MTPAYVREVVLPRQRAREGARVVAATIALVCAARYALDDHRRHHTYPKYEITGSHMHALAYEAFPIWAAWHPGRTCPRSLDELQVYLGGGTPRDAWGNSYYWSCGAHAVPRGAPGLWILSPGEDGRLGTGDDVPMEE